MKIKFYDVYERSNVFSPTHKEWALNVSINNGDKWTIYAWTRKPSAKDVEKCIVVTRRAMEIYHRNLRLPEFELETD